MLQMTLHLTRSSSLWTRLLLGFEVLLLRLQKKSHVNHFYRDTQRRDFRPLEDKMINFFRKLKFILKFIFTIFCVIELFMDGAVKEQRLRIKKVNAQKVNMYCKNPHLVGRKSTPKPRTWFPTNIFN
jgi:hypothetical protein